MANVLALAAIVLSCFIFGVIARCAPAKNINRSLNNILIAIPGYAFVKGYAESMDRSAVWTKQLEVATCLEDREFSSRPKEDNT